MNTQQKIVAAAGTAAVLLGAFALYRRFKSNPEDEVEEEEEEDIKTTKRANKKDKKNDNNNNNNAESDNDAKATKLKEEGNDAFKNKDYEKAVQLYSEALKLTSKDQHFYFSNRSAAFLAKGNTELAIQDAQRCIKLKPNWSKGYFRLGKAFLQEKRYLDAFKTFLSGLQQDSASSELRELLDATRINLNPADYDGTLRLEEHIERKFFLKLAQDLSSELGLDFVHVQQLIESTVPSLASATVHTLEPIKQSYEQRDVDTLSLVTLILLLNKNLNHHALSYAEQARALDNNNARVKLLFIQAALAERSYSEGHMPELLTLAREAVRLAPEDVVAAYALATLVAMMAQMNIDLPIREVLGDLVLARGNPKANHLLLADAGLRVWFKLFEDPEVAMKMQTENISQPAEDAQMIKSLIDGGFHDLMLEPFLLQTLLDVPLNIPVLEGLLTATVRKALSTLKDDAQFEKLKPLIFAMGVQCFRNSYAWPYSTEEKQRLNTLTDTVKTLLEQEPEQLLANEAPNAQLTHHLAIIALYRPLSIFERLPALVSKASLSQVHPSFALLLTKTVANPHAEAQLLPTLQAVTEVPQESVGEGTRRTYIWDSAGLSTGKLARVTVEEELQVTYKHTLAASINNNSKRNVLVVGCGSGQVVHQLQVAYENADVYGIDPLPANIAYAVRQLRELGTSADHVYVGDARKLHATSFPESFDVVLLQGTLALYKDAGASLTDIAKLVKPGGVVKINVPALIAMEQLSHVRRFLAAHMKKGSAIFSSPRGASALPQILRQPTEEEARQARELIFQCQDESVQAAIATHPAFYALPEFMDHVFHPHSTGFSFADVKGVIEKAGLQLVKFEVTGLPPDNVIEYQALAQDEAMSDAGKIDAFEHENPDKLLTAPPLHTINALAQKPL